MSRSKGTHWPGRLELSNTFLSVGTITEGTSSAGVAPVLIHPVPHEAGIMILNVEIGCRRLVHKSFRHVDSHPCVVDWKPRFPDMHQYLKTR